MSYPADDWRALDLADGWLQRYHLLSYRLDNAREAQAAWIELDQLVESRAELVEQLDALNTSTQPSQPGRWKRAVQAVLELGDDQAMQRRIEAAATEAKRLALQSQLAAVEQQRAELMTISIEHLATTDPFEIATRVEAATAVREQVEAEFDALCHEALATRNHGDHANFFQAAGAIHRPGNWILDRFHRPVDAGDEHRTQFQRWGPPQYEPSREEWDGYWSAWFQSVELLVEASRRYEVAPVRYTWSESTTEVREDRGSISVYTVAARSVATPLPFTLSAEAAGGFPRSEVWDFVARLTALQEVTTGRNDELEYGQQRSPLTVSILEPDLIRQFITDEPEWGKHRFRVATSPLEQTVVEYSVLEQLTTRYEQEEKRWRALGHDARAFNEASAEYDEIVAESEVERRSAGAVTAYTANVVEVRRHDLAKAEATTGQAGITMAELGLTNVEQVDSRRAWADMKAAVYNRARWAVQSELTNALAEPENAFLARVIGRQVNAEAATKALPLLRLRASFQSEGTDYVVETTPPSMSERQAFALIATAVKQAGAGVRFADVVAPEVSAALGVGGEGALQPFIGRSRLTANDDELGH